MLHLTGSLAVIDMTEMTLLFDNCFLRGCIKFQESQISCVRTIVAVAGNKQWMSQCTRYAARESETTTHTYVRQSKPVIICDKSQPEPEIVDMFD
jgi:hypothetical protein